ncbi:hypothetical protein DI09_99p60 [Mitosporidium daphniae]|uniref:UBA domain-containing protein n=1 Tax=Mitosporidium daphniae TaxID=1485682 RepID=A0A098VQH6_9MICR|nr:uncharacterized protein DI09_99p60 [Mitosporidium daphniae]KGG49961.1 hypothetical protein DI09_99p60 [Mitosporidium daphniae]|eukprot:XP_013236397.1 uncharacterized protein DI09_99p60 [Mitosporidium daphniae]
MEEYIRSKYERKMFQEDLPLRTSACFPSESEDLINGSLLTSLLEMGFGDKNRCADALLTSNGDISVAIEILSTSTGIPVNGDPKEASKRGTPNATAMPAKSTYTPPGELLAGSPLLKSPPPERTSSGSMENEKLEEFIRTLEGMGFKNRNVRNPNNLADSYLGSVLIYNSFNLEATINELVEGEMQKTQAPAPKEPQPAKPNTESGLIVPIRRSNVPVSQSASSQGSLQWRSNFGEGENILGRSSKSGLEYPRIEEFSDFISSSAKKSGELGLSPTENVDIFSAHGMGKSKDLGSFSVEKETPYKMTKDSKPIPIRASELHRDKSPNLLKLPQWECSSVCEIQKTSNLCESNVICNVDEGLHSTETLNEDRLIFQHFEHSGRSKYSSPNIDANGGRTQASANNSQATISDSAKRDTCEEDPFAELINL